MKTLLRFLDSQDRIEKKAGNQEIKEKSRSRRSSKHLDAAESDEMSCPGVMIRKIVSVEVASTVSAPVIMAVISGQSKVRSAQGQVSFGVLGKRELCPPEKEITMFSPPNFLTSLMALSCSEWCVLAVDGLAVVFLNKPLMGALKSPSFGERIHLHHLGLNGLLLLLLVGVVDNWQ